MFDKYDFMGLVDPTVREKLIGLNPDPEKHEFFIDFYQVFNTQMTSLFGFYIFDIFQFAGAPVSAKIRIQLSYEVVPIKAISYMKDLQSMYLPLLWIEDGIDMPKKYSNMLKYQLIL